MRVTRRLLAKTRLAATLLFAVALAGCVDPSLGISTSGKLPLPKADENVYVASIDAGIPIPALPVAEIPETHRRQVVAYETEQPVGTIIINPNTRLLYYVIGKDKALRYGIAVGKAGFEWSGEAIVAEKKQWPTWTPPKEMIARKPELAQWEKGQPGGPTNPLGARAIYLTSGGKDYGYRIHGTPEWQSIGRNASSGCIRMINQDVIDLYSRLQGGEKVIVLTASGEMPKGLYIPAPITPKKVKPVIPPAVVPALVILPPPSIPIGGSPVFKPAVAPVVAPVIAPTTEAPVVAPVVAPVLAPVADVPICASALVNGVCPPAAIR